MKSYMWLCDHVAVLMPVAPRSIPWSLVPVPAPVLPVIMCPSYAQPRHGNDYLQAVSVRSSTAILLFYTLRTLSTRYCQNVRRILRHLPERNLAFSVVIPCIVVLKIAF